MSTLRVAGGIAALVEALIYILGFAVMLTVIGPGNEQALGMVEKLAFALSKKSLYQGWILVIYVLFGVVLVVLVAALYERYVQAAPALAKLATAFGMIWAGLVIAAGMIANVGLNSAAALFAANPQQASALWSAVSAVQEGLGGGIELVGGLWVVLIGWAALAGHARERVVHLLGIAVGVAGILTVVPALKELGAVFGLGQIIWFAWLGVVLLRAPRALG